MVTQDFHIYSNFTQIPLYLSVFSKSLCQLMEVITGPLVHSLESRCNRNKRKIEELKQRKSELEQKLKESGQWSPIKTSAV